MHNENTGGTFLNRLSAIGSFGGRGLGGTKRQEFRGRSTEAPAKYIMASQKEIRVKNRKK